MKFVCDCERGVHEAPIDRYIIEENAINKIGEVLKDYNRVYVVCDENTYRAAGEKAEMLLKNAGKFSHKLILTGNVLPNEYNIGNVFIHYVPANAYDKTERNILPDIILAVGSGTINDICRFVSFRIGIPYAVIATAPSMDGYASSGSPLLFDNTKRTIRCTTPKYIIADTLILKEAPYEMLLSGIGDMIGKYIGLLDWELSRDYTGEYYCHKIADDVLEATNLCLQNGYLIPNRDESVIKNIMNGFMVTGLGIAYVGNSRPASGSEHIIAHQWELEDITNGIYNNLHGIGVCEASRLVAEMYKLLYAETGDPHIKMLIKKYLPYFDMFEKFCIEMRMPSPVTDYDRMKSSIIKALTLRDRYTILFYLNDRNVLEKYAEKSAEILCQKIKSKTIQ